MTTDDVRELVEFVASDEGREACDAAQAGGAIVARIDAAELASANEILRALADDFSFPEWFGMNWDALDECLRDLIIAPAPSALVFVDGFGAWRARDSREADLFLAIARDAIAHHATEGAWFRVLVADDSGESDVSRASRSGGVMTDTD